MPNSINNVVHEEPIFLNVSTSTNVSINSEFDVEPEFYDEYVEEVEDEFILQDKEEGLEKIIKQIPFFAIRIFEDNIELYTRMCLLRSLNPSIKHKFVKDDMVIFLYGNLPIVYFITKFSKSLKPKGILSNISLNDNFKHPIGFKKVRAFGVESVFSNFLNTYVDKTFLNKVGKMINIQNTDDIDFSFELHNVLFHNSGEIEFLPDNHYKLKKCIISKEYFQAFETVEDYNRLYQFKDKKNIRVNYFKNIFNKTGINSIDSEFGMYSYSYSILEGKKYTFGLEFETDSGFLPTRIRKDLNVLCEFDGSLRRKESEAPFGGEYVTGVLTGDSGVEHLKKICNVLNKYCTVNHKSGLHVHIGGFEANSEFNVYSYMLAMLLQNEFFKMLPPSRVKNSYCRKLPILNSRLSTKMSKIEYNMEIERLYNEIFYLASCGSYPNRKTNKNSQHPKGKKCGYDKSTIRYCWLNIIPTLFNTHMDNTRTIEFRNHSGTLSFRKTLNWLKICIAFVNFVENHKKAIIAGKVEVNGKLEKVDLKSMVKVCYPRTGVYLAKYIDERKETFKTMLDESLDYAEPTENLSKILKKQLAENGI
jgi:hypothetical protein